MSTENISNKDENILSSEVQNLKDLVELYDNLPDNFDKIFDYTTTEQINNTVMDNLWMSNFNLETPHIVFAEIYKVKDSDNIIHKMRFNAISLDTLKYSLKNPNQLFTNWVINDYSSEFSRIFYTKDGISMKPIQNKTKKTKIHSDIIGGEYLHMENLNVGYGGTHGERRFFKLHLSIGPRLLDAFSSSILLDVNETTMFILKPREISYSEETDKVIDTSRIGGRYSNLSTVSGTHGQTDDKIIYELTECTPNNYKTLLSNFQNLMEDRNNNDRTHIAEGNRKISDIEKFFDKKKIKNETEKNIKSYNEDGATIDDAFNINKGGLVIVKNIITDIKNKILYVHGYNNLDELHIPTYVEYLNIIKDIGNKSEELKEVMKTVLLYTAEISEAKFLENILNNTITHHIQAIEENIKDENTKKIIDNLRELYNELLRTEDMRSVLESQPDGGSQEDLDNLIKIINSTASEINKINENNDALTDILQQEEDIINELNDILYKISVIESHKNIIEELARGKDSEKKIYSNLRPKDYRVVDYSEIFSEKNHMKEIVLSHRYIDGDNMVNFKIYTDHIPKKASIIHNNPELTHVKLVIKTKEDDELKEKTICGKICGLYSILNGLDMIGEDEDEPQKPNPVKGIWIYIIEFMIKSGDTSNKHTIIVPEYNIILNNEDDGDASNVSEYKMMLITEIDYINCSNQESETDINFDSINEYMNSTENEYMNYIYPVNTSNISDIDSSSLDINESRNLNDSISRIETSMDVRNAMFAYGGDNSFDSNTSVNIDNIRNVMNISDSFASNSNNSHNNFLWSLDPQDPQDPQVTPPATSGATGVLGQLREIEGIRHNPYDQHNIDVDDDGSFSLEPDEESKYEL